MKESKILEFKADITNTFLKTVSAYANFGTGEIKFGIKDDGTICGIGNAKQICLDIENKINDSISPKPDFSLKVDNKTSVITLKVQEGLFKPYFYKSKAYRRSDTATVEVDSLELKRLALEGSNMSYDEVSCHDDDLTFKYFEQKIITCLNISEFSMDVQRTLGLVNKDKRYNNAAALLADKNTFSGIDMARFGEDTNIILDREDYIGESILKQYDKAVTMYKKYYQYEIIDGIKRGLVETIPEVAFREAVANALVHRTWDINTSIKIAMHKDKIVIVSPGGLPKGLTEEDYLKDFMSRLRNPILANVFYRLNYIEMFGTGIRRILNSYKDSVLQPRFEITDNFIVVILPVLNAIMEVSKDEQVIINVLKEGISFSNAELVEATGMNRAKVGRLVKSLVSKNYIKQIGNQRGTKYCLKMPI